MQDPDGHRAEARAKWEAIAGGWELADDFSRCVAPVSEAMVAAVAPRPGQTILELAAGRGDTGLMTAEAIRPDGRLIISDGAQEMVRGAERHANAQGVDDAEFRTLELESLDVDAATIDAILCRFGYMHAVDPEAALRDARRVLKPAGRIGLAVWDLQERNPWLNVPRIALNSVGDGPGAFALSADGQVEELLAAAGFGEREVRPVEIVFAAASLDAMWQLVMGISSTMVPLVRALSPAEHTALRDEVDAGWSQYVAADGTVAVPGRAWVASATA